MSYVAVCSGVHILLLGSNVATMFTSGGSTIGLEFAWLQPFAVYPWQTCVFPGDGPCPM